MFVEKTLDGKRGIKDLRLIFEKSHISNNSEPYKNVPPVFAAFLIFSIIIPLNNKL